MHHFRQMLPSIIKTFEVLKTNISRTWNNNSCIDAQGLLQACSNFEFIVTLVIVESIFTYCREVTILLQERENDLVKAYNQISLLKTTLCKIRNNIDTYHKSWYEKSIELATKIGVKPKELFRCLFGPYYTTI